jgi:hypothetical protein
MFGIKFIKIQPTTYLLQYRGGKVVREGLGLSFFYYAPTTSLVAVPVGSTDVPFIFQETTADFQAVTIQGQVTYRVGEASETQSSSGVIVSTGMGSTGWLKSLLTGAAAITQLAGSVLAKQLTNDLFDTAKPGQKNNGKARLNVKTEFAWDANCLFFTVREPFPTKTTGASLVFGRVTKNAPLILESQMAENGVIFSDGIEKDFLEFNSGTKAVIGIAEKQGVLIE